MPWDGQITRDTRTHTHARVHTHMRTHSQLPNQPSILVLTQTPDSPKAFPGADNTGTDYREATGLSRLLKQKAISHCVRFQCEANSVISIS